MSVELPATSRHRRDMTERLLKVTLSPNQTNANVEKGCNQFCKGKQSSFLCIGKQLWIHNYFPSLYRYHNYSNYFHIQKTCYGDIFGDNSWIIFFLFLHKKHILLYSLEVVCHGALNAYLLHDFMVNWKKLSQNYHQILLPGPLGEPLKPLKTLNLAEKPIKTFILMKKPFYLAICKCKRRTE